MCSQFKKRMINTKIVINLLYNVNKKANFRIVQRFKCNEISAMYYFYILK